DAVNVCAASMLDHMFRIETRQKNINNNKNKGEWTELYTFLKTIVDKKLLFADKKLNVLDPASHFTVTKVSTLNILEACLLTESDEVIVENEHTHKRESIFVSSFLNAAVLKDIVASIKAGSRTFAIPQVDVIQGLLGISIIKGGTSRQKADIVLDVKKDGLVKHNEGFGIKSYLGSKPTLLNASGNTNFVFRIDGLEKQHVDSINSINSRTKLMDRLNAIDKNGGVLSFEHTERPTMQYNLELVDSEMPKIIALMLLEFYLNRTSLVEDNIANVYATHFANTETNRDLQFFQVKVKRLLVGALLGFFAGSKWDGKYIANGTIIVKENGEQVGFHIIESTHLEDYLFEHIKFDTPSTTRHRFGRIITERNGQLFFKLNLQLRFK
ncbi:MAG: HpaII family restriction endonuclease, partial [Candidatus Promineifilaceae bacterium]